MNDRNTLAQIPREARHARARLTLALMFLDEADERPEASSILSARAQREALLAAFALDELAAHGKRERAECAA